jgi:putative colanic acid biosynthesis UDP-glucose lipid carrier transferase
MVIGSIIFLNLATEGDIVGNSLFLNKMIPITVLSWLFQLLTFNCIESMNCLVCSIFFAMEVFLTQRVLWHGYIFILMMMFFIFFW